MKYSELLLCLEQTNLSPEKMAPYFSVSNMTLRRWTAKKNQKVQDSEMNNVMNGLFSLIGDGHLSIESQIVQNLVEKNFRSSAYFVSVIKTLGLPKSVASQGDFEERIVESLRAIGKKEKQRSYVESKILILPIFLKKTGKEFSQRALSLVDVIKSKSLSKQQKFIAYGALFYFFLPFDLIPDHIPVFGLLDDFAVLGFAVSYYQNIETKVFGGRSVEKERE